MTENRESFFKRVEPFFAPSVLNNVELAYTLAKYGHRAQVRKELEADGSHKRYFEHVRRVAIILIDEIKIVRPEMVICALMHDVVEDAPNLPPRLIEHSFGTDVICIIKTLSKVPKEGYLERFYMSTDWRPYVIKACDRLDNLRSLKTAEVSFRIKQVAETREKYYDLFDRMMTLTPDEHLPRVRGLRDAIRQETERQATFLEAEKASI